MEILWIMREGEAKYDPDTSTTYRQGDVVPAEWEGKIFTERVKVVADPKKKKRKQKPAPNRMEKPGRNRREG